MYLQNWLYGSIPYPTHPADACAPCCMASVLICLYASLDEPLTVTLQQPKASLLGTMNMMMIIA
jgi:hypothetical protein